MHTTNKHNQSTEKLRSSDNSINQEGGDQKNKKRIVSYSLDVELLHQIRKVAQRQDRYYSSIVSEALQTFLHQQRENPNTR